MSLRESGDNAEAIVTLRRLLESVSVTPLRAQVLQTLAICLFHELRGSHPQKDENERLSEIYGLYQEARSVPDLSDEDKGLLELNACNPLAFEGRLDEALQSCLRARNYLLRCNSRHLDICQRRATQLERLLASTERQS